MRKFLAMIMVAALALSLFAACGSTEETTDASGDAEETTSIEDRTTFRVGFDAEFPPYGYMEDDGTYTGFDLEMAEAVCEFYGWTFEAVPIDWDSKDMELDSGAIDCIWNGFTYNGRETQYEWTIPYVDNSQVILTSADSGIQTEADLAGKKVGVQVASAADQLLQEGGDREDLAETFGEIVPFNSYNTAFVELQSGSVDAVIIDIGVAKYQVESREDDDYVILDEPVASEQYAVGFKLGNTELRDAVQDGILRLVADGTFEELAEKYSLTDMICLSRDDVAGEVIDEVEGTQEPEE